ncbi:MAG: sugar nucleotide-binding protein, partial [Verrucomicrobiae bacterium]|nr:sugar nucleotide-binding protein [Verrucomicrobiae bacterium]
MIDDLVLGAGGNLGQALCRRLLKSGRAVAGTYFTHRPDFSEVRLFQADVSSNDLGALVGKLQPKRVFHLAWSTDLDACERSE